MSRLTPDRKSGLETRIFSIPPHFLPYLTGAIAELSDPRTWLKFGDMSVEESSYFFEELLSGMYTPFIGSIFSTAGKLPSNCLWCDGSSILASDYPELLDMIDPALVHSDFIILPDLNQKFLLGSNVVGDTGGEKDHTLTELEMPIHNHGEHIHPPGQFTGEIPTPIPDMAIPDPLSNRGGGMPHNNMPPFFTVKYYMVVR